MKTTTVAAAAIGCLLALTGCSVATDATSSGSSGDADSSTDVIEVDATTGEYIDLADLTAVTLESLDLPGFEPQTSGAVALDLSDPTATDGVSVDGADVVISAGGSYLVSGEWNGRLVVAVEDEDITLVLDGVDITSDGTGALVIDSADEAHVYLASGTTSTLTDGAVASEEDTVNAALFSSANLWIGGQGTLVVNGADDGITSKDSLLIDAGTLEVTAGDDGIRGKHHLVILDGSITVNAAGDALKSDDESGGYDASLDVGTVWIAGGTINLTAGSDGIDAFRQVSIDGGSLTVAAADDGLHTEGVLTVAGGEVTVTESYEGLEAAVMDLSGGTIDVTASDDGINVAGGFGVESSGDGMGGPGGGPGGGGPGGQGGATDASAASRWLTISGGTITVNAEGDGIDVGGVFTYTGGTTVVAGPTGNGDGALDVDSTFTISGGLLIAGGSAGMAESPEGDGVGVLSAQLGGTAGAGTTISVTDEDGQVVATYVAPKAFQSLVMAGDGVQDGETYVFIADADLTGGDAVGTAVIGGSVSGGDTLGSLLAS